MLLDSNILIYAAGRLTPQAVAMAVSEGNSVASITQIEVYGYPGLRIEESHALDIVFARLTIHPLDHSVIKRAIALRQSKRIKLADAIIAATALEHRIALVTRNTADFKGIPDLEVIDPFA
jgi:predicted nucleic acid-binding protein